MTLRTILPAVLALALSGCASKAVVTGALTVPPNTTYAVDRLVTDAPIRVGDGAKVTGTLAATNGSVDVGEGAATGDLKAVNGSVTVGQGARTGAVHAINGSLRIGRAAQTGSLSAINGSVALLAGATARGRVEAVNGDVTVEEGARVEGDLDAVGDVTISGGIVDGDIILRRHEGSRPLHVTIGPGSLVRGRVIVDGSAQVRIERTARVRRGIDGVVPSYFELQQDN
jgi:DUF4097 and DUF4098 domain-containing protein YvlB